MGENYVAQKQSTFFIKEEGMKMNQSKYSKYVIQGKGVPFRTPEREGKILHELVAGEEEYPDSSNWIYAGLVYQAGTGFAFGDSFEMTMPDGEFRTWKSNPHTHEDAAETFIFLGTDPNKPGDLGAEVEIWLGAGEEAEKFTITKSASVFIPPNLAHGPVWVKNLNRPFTFLAILDDPKGSEELGDIPFPSDFSKNL